MFKYCFNTSHVVVYQVRKYFFQSRKKRFNTSHVVVYLNAFTSGVTKWAFQYISCCSLSRAVHEINWGGMFQYISCCSLSRKSGNISTLIICFNTSHVVVYRWSMLLYTPVLLRFNTSHVVVYQLADQVNITAIFGFNTSHVVVYRKDLTPWMTEVLFQYISCCSLSCTPAFTPKANTSFNTSHVVVYQFDCWVIFTIWHVSIHLML